MRHYSIVVFQQAIGFTHLRKTKSDKNLVVSRKNPAGSLRMLHFNCTNRKIAELFQRREDKGRDFQLRIQSFSFNFFKLYLTMTEVWRSGILEKTLGNIVRKGGEMDMAILNLYYWDWPNKIWMKKTCRKTQWILFFQTKRAPFYFLSTFSCRQPVY